jgi:hypothetical protein
VDQLQILAALDAPTNHILNSLAILSFPENVIESSSRRIERFILGGSRSSLYFMIHFNYRDILSN